MQDPSEVTVWDYVALAIVFAGLIVIYVQVYKLPVSL